MGSTSLAMRRSPQFRLDQHVAVVHHGRDVAGGTMVVELCWMTSAGPAIVSSASSFVALVARRLARFAIVEDGPPRVELGVGRIAASALGELRQLQRLDRHRRDDAQRHHLAGLVAEGVAIDLLVGVEEILDD